MNLNNIADLPIGMFDELDKLEILDISQSTINWQSGVFDKLRNIKLITLDWFLDNDCVLYPWIVKAIATGTNVRFVPKTQGPVSDRNYKLSDGSPGFNSIGKQELSILTKAWLEEMHFCKAYATALSTTPMSVKTTTLSSSLVTTSKKSESSTSSLVFKRTTAISPTINHVTSVKKTKDGKTRPTTEGIAFATTAAAVGVAIVGDGMFIMMKRRNIKLVQSKDKKRPEEENETSNETTYEQSVELEETFEECPKELFSNIPPISFGFVIVEESFDEIGQ